MFWRQNGRQKLLAMAEDIKKNSYSPYSKFRVGAAVLAKSGKVFTEWILKRKLWCHRLRGKNGCFKAVSEGEREIAAVAISSDSDEYTFPCGICRQVLREFGDDDTKVICGNKNGEFTVFRLGELLPNAFSSFEIGGFKIWHFKILTPEVEYMAFKSGFVSIVAGQT